MMLPKVTFRYRRSVYGLIFILIYRLLLVSCDQNNKKEASFSFPDIIYSSERFDFYFSPQAQWHSEPYIYQIYHIDSCVDLNRPAIPWPGAFQNNDSVFAISQKTTGLDIYVDTSKEIPFKMRNFDPPPVMDFIQTKKLIDKNYIPSHIDSIAYNIWKDWIRDLGYIKTVRAYPVYIVNNTDSNIVVNNSSHQLKMILEAKDLDNNWMPIEHTNWHNHSFYYNTPVILNPRHYIFTKVFKFTGDYKTLIRIKFKNGNSVIYSKPFSGYINQAQIDTGTNLSKEAKIQYYLTE